MIVAVPSDWHERDLGELLSESDERVGARSDLPLLSITKHDGAVLAKDRFSRVLASKDLSRYRVARRNSVVIDPMLLWDGVIALQHRFAEGVVSPDYRVFLFASDTDPEFFDYLAHSFTLRRQYARAARGTNVRRRRISRNDFLALRVVVPPPREQRAIAAVLKSVDDAIAAGEAVVEQHRRVRHDLMAQLLLGQASTAWPTIRLGEAGEWLSGGTPNKALPELWTGPVPWVSPKDMKRSRIGDAEDHVSEAAAMNGTRLVEPGTLLMVVRGMILAHTFPVALTTATVAFNQDIKALRPRDDLLPEYLLYWLTAMQPEVLNIVDVANHGTKRLATERLHDLSLPVPPAGEQQRIVEVLRALDVRSEVEAAVVSARRRLKMALADGLLSGKIRVPVQLDLLDHALARGSA